MACNPLEHSIVSQAVCYIESTTDASFIFYSHSELWKYGAKKLHVRKANNCMYHTDDINKTGTSKDAWNIVLSQIWILMNSTMCVRCL